ncbi:transposase, partial [Elysia marginata]
MASKKKMSSMSTRNDARETKFTNTTYSPKCERSFEQEEHSSFNGAECKENKTVGKELSVSYQLMVKASTSICPGMFDFSSESEEETVKANMFSLPLKSPLKEQNINSSKGFISKEVYVNALSKHLMKENSFETTPLSLKTKSKTVAVDSNLEWESLLESPDHPKKLATASGKKRLFSGKNSDVHFHSTPKQTKSRSKQVSSFLLKKLSQSLESNDSKNVSNPASICCDENVNLDQSSQIIGEDEFVDVQDSSAQTSFQPEVLNNLDECYADYKNDPLPYPESNSRKNLDEKQEDVQHENQNVSGHSLALSAHFTKRDSETSAGGKSDSNKSSSSSYHAQSFVDFDNEDSVIKSQVDAQITQSFVDVQDASVQPGSMLATEQVETSGSLNCSKSPSISPGKLAGTSLKKQDSQKHKQNFFDFLEPEQASPQKIISRCSEDNSSASSNSLMFLSALEDVPGRTNVSDCTQMISNPVNCHSKAHTCSNSTSTNTSNSSEGLNQDSLCRKNETSTTRDSDEAVADVNEPGILVENTDSSDSEEEEADDKSPEKVAASFSEGSVSDEDIDFAQERTKLLFFRGQKLVDENSFCKAKISESRDDLEIKTFKGGSFLEKDVPVMESIGTDDSDGCSIDRKVLPGHEKADPVSEITDILKSTTISRRRKFSDSSDDDDAFDKFLAKMKAPSQSKKDEEVQLETSMSEFIAADDEDLSGESSSQSKSSEDEMFHVRADNILDSKRRPSVKPQSLAAALTYSLSAPPSSLFTHMHTRGAAPMVAWTDKSQRARVKDKERWGRDRKKEFNEGKESLSNCPRLGLPKSCVNEQTIASIKRDIDENHHISVRELSDTNDLSYGTVHTIITEHLRMKKVFVRWIPHLLTVDQKRERVRCAVELLNMFESLGLKRLSNIVPGDETWFPFFIIPPKRLNRMWVDGQGDRPVVLRPGFQSRKRMFTVFFNYSGPLVVDILHQDTTMTATYYVQKMLFQERLAGRNFDRIQDLAKAVNSELRTIPEEDYQGVFRKWQIRLKRCIESHGEVKSSSYFEEDNSEESDEDVRSKAVLELSSDDDDLLNDFIKDVNEKLQGPQEKTSPLNSRDSNVTMTPQSKHNSEAVPVDDQSHDQFKMPFKTPKKQGRLPKAWERPFETPAADQRMKPLLVSSELKKDQRSCPMTVSRLHHLSRRSNIGLDEDAVFLKSLTEDYPDYKRHPEALRYLKNFKDRKADLTKRLFSIYNKSIFKEQLPSDLEIEWSALYRKTAGTFCYRASPKEAKITLSVKVCDRA